MKKLTTFLTHSTFKSKDAVALCYIAQTHDVCVKYDKRRIKYLLYLLLGALLLLSPCVNSDAQVIKEDSLALVDLYNFTNGGNWTGGFKWDLKRPVGDWSYVVIRNKRVVGLMLSKCGLAGTIPASIGDLTALDFLDLSSNQLGGSIPSSLGNIGTDPQSNSPFLQLRIFLNNNQFTGSIPSSLGNLRGPTTADPALGGAWGSVEIELSFNHLTGSIPSSLSNILPLFFGQTSTVSLDYNDLTLSPTLAPFVIGGTTFRYTVNGKVNNISTSKVVDISARDNIRKVTYPANGAVNVNTSLNISSVQITSGSPSTYTIQLSETPSFGTIAFEETGSSRTLAFLGLKYNTTYYTRVKTNFSSVYGQVTSFSTRPIEPLLFVASPVNNALNQNIPLNVTANYVPGAASYTVQLSESSDFSTVAFEKTSTNRTILFSGLKYNTTYYNRVKTDLSAAFGAVKSFSTKAIEPLLFVASPADNALNQSLSLNVTANYVPGAASYTVQLSESSDFSTVAFEKTSTNRTILFSGLKYNTTYHNRVRTDLSVAFGAVKSFSTKAIEPLLFVASPADNALNQSLSLNVTANYVPGAASYTVQLSESSDFSTVAFEKTSANRTILFSGLKYNTTYHNRVRTDLSVAFGGVKSFSTKAIEPLLFVASPADNALNQSLSLNVTANNVPGATSYTIELNTSSDFTGTSFVKTSGRTQGFSGLSYSTIYYTRVKTDLSPNYGTSTSFTTVSSPSSKSSPSARIADNSPLIGKESSQSDLSDEVTVSVFPNPSKDHFTIAVASDLEQNVELRFFDITGRQVYSSAQQTNQLIEAGREFGKGMYIMQVNTPLKSKTVKVIKE